MPSYDILNGGLEKLQKDLDDYINYLTYANHEIVYELSKVGRDDILMNANRADEPETRIALGETNVIQGMRSKNIAKDMIVNNNPKASFNEFGYGIIGANSAYKHDDFLKRYDIGWYGYDINTPNKLPNRSWWYKDAYGRHNTFGATPRNTFYNAGQTMIKRFPDIANRILRRFPK